MYKHLGIVVRVIGALLVSGLIVAAPVGRTITAGQEYDLKGFNKIQKRTLSGFASFELDPAYITTMAAPKNYQPRGSGDCTGNLASNIKVNQNCLNVSDPDLSGRGQAQNETTIAADPNQPNHLVASANDYRRGDGTCGTYWSVDGGRTWNDSTLPNGFVRGGTFGGVAREYFQASGDPSVAWDSKGNAYLSCQTFKRGPGVSNDPDQSSGIYLFRSTGNNGASWNFPGRPVVEQFDTSGATLIDKPLMMVDNTAGSPFQDRIYVTWTFYAADGTAYIYGSYSSDYGETFSAPVVVSIDSALCPNTYGVPTPNGRCNENQFSQPFTAPDGTLYVVWANFNNGAASANDNHYQLLLAKSTDGGATFSDPVKVADYYDLPDCATYQAGQDPGRTCVPEKGSSTNSIFRAANYPAAALNPTKPNQVVVTFGSYINSHSNESNGCVPEGFSPLFGTPLYDGVKTPGACNNDILVSVSQNGGASFTGTTTDPRQLPSATSAAGQATTDQWFQWAAFTKNGKFAVSYYDRQYGDDEMTGFSDFSLSGSADFSKFAVTRVSSGSMPPPTGFSGVFWGDYTGMTASNNANPMWSDTRSPALFPCKGPGGAPAVCTAQAANANIANDQDVYTANVGVPSK
jgi:hypothetical protein